MQRDGVEMSAIETVLNQINTSAMMVSGLSITEIQDAYKELIEKDKLQARVAELEAVRDVAQKIYDAAEQDGRYGDGSYALVLKDEYENSAILVKLGEALEKVNS